MINAGSNLEEVKTLSTSNADLENNSDSVCVGGSVPIRCSGIIELHSTFIDIGQISLY
jgi:hypothetical protein